MACTLWVCTSQACISWGVPHDVYLMDVYLMDVYLMDVYLINVHLTGVHLMSVHLICESSLRSGPGWRGSLYQHQGCFEASDCGRLDRQAAGHPWSALHVVKSCRKTAQRPRCCSKPKQQLCIQNGTRAYYLTIYIEGGGEAGKRSAGNRIGWPIRWTEK